MAVTIYTAAGRAIRSAVQGTFWSECKDKVAYIYETKQMKWQLWCHTDIVPLKATWNLDMWVKRSSYADSVLNKCN